MSLKDSEKCKIPNCDRPYYGHWLCNAHYQQRRQGRLIKPIRPNRKNGEVALRDSAGRKQCIACLLWLSTAFFSAHGKTVDKLQVRCLSCVNAGRVLILYGLDKHDIANRMLEQAHACAICKVDISGRYVIDHNHNCCPQLKTCGKCIRGLLCGGCNLGLGAFKDNPNYMLSAIKYILRADHKGGIEDLKKAIWYLQDEVKRMENEGA